MRHFNHFIASRHLRRIAVALFAGTLVTVGYGLWIARCHMIEWDDPYSKRSIYGLQENAWGLDTLHSGNDEWAIEAYYSPTFVVFVTNLWIDDQVVCDADSFDQALQRWWQPYAMRELGGRSRAMVPHWSLAACYEGSHVFQDNIHEQLHEADVIAMRDYASGWPCYALRGGGVFVERGNIGEQWPDEQMEVFYRRPGFWLGSDDCSFTLAPHMCRLPVTPIFPGFVVNTVLYGGIFYSIWWLVPGAYRRIRAKRCRLRGRCVGCGYSLTGLTADRCPECGGEI